MSTFSKGATADRNIGDQNVDALQAAGNRALSAANANALGRGVLLDTDTPAGSVAQAGIVFTAGTPKQLLHRLGTVPRGWLVVDAVGGYAAFYRTAVDSATITLQSQNNCTAKVWVFA